MTSLWLVLKLATLVALAQSPGAGAVPVEPIYRTLLPMFALATISLLTLLVIGWRHRPR